MIDESDWSRQNLGVDTTSPFRRGGDASPDYRPRLTTPWTLTRNGLAIRLQVNLHLTKLQMQDNAWIGLVFFFLQLLLASRSEGENLLDVVEQGARVASTVEGRVDVPGGAKTWSIRLLATVGSSGGVPLLVM